jgi:dinuclear metal center YbgI/SA1388 family protein
MKIVQFIQKFEEYFPTHLAYKWDNVGLQLGDKNSEITNILLSLDLTEEVIDEAIRNNANFVIVHHPIIFSPIKAITADNYLGNMIIKAIKNNINIYVAHTNFDLSNFGMNKILADLLELQEQKIIEMETLEEGLGRFGLLKETISLMDFVNNVKSIFDIDSAKLIGNVNLDKLITSVAICGGSGSSLLSNKTLESCDIYISGDITYHHALDAINNGLTVLDVGHNIEKKSLNRLLEIVMSFSNEFKVVISNIDTNPYKNV